MPVNAMTFYISPLAAHETSHTIGRHGPDVTNDQLLLRAQTGIAPDGSFAANPPGLSTRFGSNEKMVTAKNDVLDQIDAGNFTVAPNGEMTVKITSTDVYGQGISRGAPVGTFATNPSLQSTCLFLIC